MNSIDMDALAEAHFSHDDPAFQDDEAPEGYEQYEDLFDQFGRTLRYAVQQIMNAVIAEDKSPAKFAEYFAEDAADLLQQEIERWKD